MKKGELVLFISEDSSHVFQIADEKVNTSDGWIDLTELKKKEYGDKIKTSTGKTFLIIKPNLLDILKKRVKRSAQVMLPKDIASIISNTGIDPDSLIIDAGTGTGYLSIFLAKLLPKSIIVTYESDKEFYNIAKKNMRACDVWNVKIKNRDVTKGIQEKNADLVVLDLKNSHLAVKHAYKSLKVGGWIAAYSPTADHLLKVAKFVRSAGFADMKIVETIEREWQYTKTIRPKTIGMMHTGFLTFARKI
jgi:tRNA (adenine57-N1/adenine58-N1)-methyltransferase